MSHPPRSVLTVLAALPWAAGRARTFTGQTLATWRLPHLIDTAELLVSELITNAVKHAGGVTDPSADLSWLAGKVPPVLLGVSVLDALLIEVWDVSSTPPLRRTAEADAESGRGLELVDALSMEWGCRVLATGGKIIWLALALDGAR